MGLSYIAGQTGDTTKFVIFICYNLVRNQAKAKSVENTDKKVQVLRQILVNGSASREEKIMSNNYQASCACGKVSFTLDDEPHTTFNCHCTICRKMNGSAFSTYSVFPKNSLRITEGEQEIQTIKMGNHGAKHFCRHCGAPLFGLHDHASDICLVVLGSINSGGSILPVSNIFCGSKLSWAFEIDKMIHHEGSM